MRNQKGEGLVAVLVVLAIILIAVVIYFGRSTNTLQKSQRKDGLGVTTVGSVRAKALDTKCVESLRQIRMAIKMQMEGSEEGQAPQTLQEVSGITESMQKCPIGQEPYKYDPATGQVHCEHPGHENL